MSNTAWPAHAGQRARLTHQSQPPLRSRSCAIESRACRSLSPPAPRPILPSIHPGAAMKRPTIGSALRSVTVVCLLVSWLAVAQASAQEQGTITGRITGDAGAPLASAQVVVEGTNLVPRSVPDGSYRLSGVPPGPAVFR